MTTAATTAAASGAIVFFAIVLYAFFAVLGLMAAYWVVRLAVRHALRDARAEALEEVRVASAITPQA